MGIKFSGIEEFQKRLETIKAQLGIVGAQTIEDVLIIGKEVAFRDAPFVTGNLRNNIRYALNANGREGTLTSGAPYSYNVNFGSAGRKRTPFFTNAVLMMDLQLLKILENNVALAMQGKLQRKAKAQTQKTSTGVKVHKYLYKTYTRSGRVQRVYSKSRSGTVKTRGRVYTGRNYRAKFEST